MPDTKLTWTGLKDHLRRYAVIYIVGIVLAVVLSNLLFTVTTPRVPDDQAVVIYLADAYTNGEALASVAAETLVRTQADDPTLRSVEFQNLMFSDPEDDYTGLMVLMTRLALGEGDAFLACQSAMDALVNANALLPLDDYAAAGWLAESGLEPYYAEVEDEETGARTKVLAGYRLDTVDALARLGAFNNEGAYLAIAANGTNIPTTLKAVEYMIDELTREGAYD